MFRLSHPWRPAMFLALAACTLAAVAGPAGHGKQAGRKPFSRLSAGPVEPWSLDRPARPFADVCFEDRSTAAGLSEAEAGEWLEKVDGRPLELSRPRDRSALLRFRGLAKLRQWAPDAALRLSFTGPLRIHFWKGPEGIALYYYPNPPQWAAYRTTLQPGQSPPASQPAGAPPMLLVATDDHRSLRLVDDTCEVRCQNGDIVLTKGDVRLLTAPLGGEPTAVYLESAGGAAIRDLAVCRSGPAPDDPLLPHPTVPGKESAAALPWREHLSSGSRFSRLADGSVELSAAAAAPAWVTLPAPRPGLYEAVLEIDAASPGSGVFLSGSEEARFQGVEFVRHQGNGWTTLIAGSFTPSGAVRAAAGPDHEQKLTAYAGGRQWLRLVWAAGCVKCSTSGDGIHWGQAAFLPLQKPETWQYVGLYVDAPRQDPRPGDKTAAAIRIRSVQFRQLDGITGLVANSLQQEAFARIAKAREKADKPDLAAWGPWVEANRPPRAEPARWRIACAVAVLGCGPPPWPPDATRAALADLLQDGLRQAGSVEARIALLQDAALVWGVRPTDDADRYLAAWEQVLRSLVVDADDAGFDLARRSFMATSLWPREPRVECIPWQVARDRLLVLLGRQQWDSMHRWCGQLVFWRRTLVGKPVWPPEQAPLRQLVEWALEELGLARSGPDGQKTVATEMSWERSLVLPVNREACGFLSDLQAAADDRLFQDVAHGLATASLPAGGGLVPDGEDPLLFTSLPTAVELLVDRYPQIRGAINDRFAPADQLRVTQAIAEGDAAAVERVTVHYCGTPAAASAHAWLGDRFLSGGAFVSALDHYRRAQSAAPPGGRLGLAARVRLAAAMLGRDEGEPVRGPVVLGGQEIAAEQFENWVREMLARERPRGAAANGPQRPLTLLPAGLEPKRLMAFDGDLGQEGGPPPFSAPTDWVARQLAVAPAGDVLLVSNRFQVAAIELGSARRRWTCSLGGDQGPRQGWPAVPMRPVAAGRRVYARLLPKSGHPQIACLDLATGTRLWQRDCPGDIISDPLLVGNRVLALAVESPPGLPPALAWVEFDRDSGDVIARKFLLELRSAWRAHQMCQATVVGQRVVAAVGGLLFSFDPDKQILWLRTSLVVPPSIDYMLGFPYPEPPLAADGRLYATQSGLPTVECVDAETGRAYWRRCLPGLRRIVDLTDDRLVVSAGDSLVALRARTGEILWRREVPGLLEGVIKPGPGLLLCGSTKSLGGGFSCPALLWLDLETGRTKAQNPLTALRAKQPALGPMVAMHNRLWCFTGDRVNPGDPKRDIVELAPKGPAQPPDPEQP